MPTRTSPTPRTCAHSRPSNVLPGPAPLSSVASDLNSVSSVICLSRGTITAITGFLIIRIATSLSPSSADNSRSASLRAAGAWRELSMIAAARQEKRSGRQLRLHLVEPRVEARQLVEPRLGDALQQRAPVARLLRGPAASISWVAELNL